MCSFMCTTRNFVSVLYGITLSSNKTCGRAGFLFCVVWNYIAIVLPAFTIRLFEANHVSISCITLFSLDWTMFRLSPDISMFVSSANS